MAKTKTEFAIDELNRLNGKKYPDIGYIYRTDLIGNSGKPAIYVIINSDGGVSRSELNGNNVRDTLKKIWRETWRVRDEKGMSHA